MSDTHGRKPKRSGLPKRQDLKRKRAEEDYAANQARRNSDSTGPNRSHSNRDTTHHSSGGRGGATGSTARGETGRGSQPRWKPRGGSASESQRKTGTKLVGASSGKKASAKGASQTVRSGKNRKTASENGRKPQRKWPKRLGVGLLCTFLGLIIVGVAGFAIAYATIRVPEPGEFALAQKTTVYYADGKTEMGTFAEMNRTIIDTSQIPDYVGQAVVSSEDRTFFTNSGIDLKGIARAFINNITGGDLQGASTLLQQYVERYYLDTTTGYLGKAKEAILALKINKQQSKAEILDNYLNTIYFGRGSYGIEEAAKNYFGVHAKQLNVSQAAMLAGIIPAPSAWDPAQNMNMAQQRWERVRKRMVEDGWISSDDAKKMKFPDTIKGVKNESMKGTNGYLMQQVRSELASQAGISAEQVDSGGYKIISTIDQNKQKAAVDAVNALPEGASPNLHVALSSVNPENGEIYALYGGKDYQKIQRNAATQDIAMAGSTFKPFGLVAYAAEGGSLHDRYSGNSPLTLPDGTTVHNYANQSYGTVDMVRATALSINTAFIQMNQSMGAAKTRDAAIKLGIPEKTQDLDENLGNILGSSAPHNIDLTRAYSTIAAGGQRTTPHIVREVTDTAGNTLYRGSTAKEEVFKAEDMSKVLPGLKAAAQWGSADKARNLGRPVAGKTGSSEENKSAQFAGFIPQMATVVTMYQEGDNGSVQSITPFGGYGEITGATIPGDLWLKYMAAATDGMEVKDFDWVTTPSGGSSFQQAPPPPAQPQQEEPSEEPSEQVQEEEEQPQEPQRPQPEPSQEPAEPEQPEAPSPTEEPDQ